MNWSNERKCDISTNISTYMDSYRRHNQLHESMTKYTRAKMEKPSPKPPPKIELELDTLSPLDKSIPFNLMIVPNEITDKNAYSSANRSAIQGDSINEEVGQRTYPKVYITPQVSLDDIPNQKMKKFLLDQIYTSVSRKKDLELLTMVEIDHKEKRSANIDQQGTANYDMQHNCKINFNPRPLLQAKITPKQIQRGKIWTNEQIVSNIDVTERFWRNKSIKKTDPTLTTLIKKEIKNHINDLVQTEDISIAHDNLFPGYAGYKPVNAIGIKISKTDLPHMHPLVSTYQRVFNSKRGGRNIPKCI